MRELDEIRPAGHGRHTLGGEPVIFHCNHYNYWLQHTLRLVPDIDMDPVIRDAAESVATASLSALAAKAGASTPEEVFTIAGDVFAELGFGLMDFSGTSAEGGEVRTPVSHYGDALAVACEGEMTRDQNLFDQGFAAAALAVAHGRPAGSYEVAANHCKARGAEVGRIVLRPVSGAPRAVVASPGVGHVGTSTPAPVPTAPVDEAGVLEALAGLDFSGNEEGLLPRFGVTLTHHFANFYNRVSFEFVRRMAGSGLEDEAVALLVEAGHRCAFNTFGGIMISAEWDAVVRPQLGSRGDWVHGMVAVVNALGWGVWRVAELDERRVVIRIWDDYESCGWLGMFGETAHPVSYLATGGVAGLMNLVYPGDIASRPSLDPSFYSSISESAGRFAARQTRSLAAGDPFTEIVAERR